jgi:aminotransferase
MAPIRPSAIRRMLDLSSKVKDVIHLEQGEPDFVTPRHVIEAAEKAMRDGVTHYTPVDGTLDLRAAIAEKLSSENGIHANPEDEVIVTSGSQETMLAAALGFLNPGDEALVMSPYYPAHYEDVLLAEAVPVQVPFLGRCTDKVDATELQKRISPKTRMIWICNPSNPIGYAYTRHDLEAIAEMATAHDLIVFSDEIYEKLVYDGVKHLSIASIPGMEDRTITANGFSKAYAMTGWRLGYMVADSALAETLRALHYYMALCPPSVSQAAALAALTGPQECVGQMVREYAKRRLLAARFLKRMKPLDFQMPSGAFYYFPRIMGDRVDDEAFAVDMLRKARVVTVPGSGFGDAGRGHLRISYSVDSRTLETGLERMQEYMESLRPA